MHRLGIEGSFSEAAIKSVYIMCMYKPGMFMCSYSPYGSSYYTMNNMSSVSPKLRVQCYSGRHVLIILRVKNFSVEICLQLIIYVVFFSAGIPENPFPRRDRKKRRQFLLHTPSEDKIQFTDPILLQYICDRSLHP